MKKIPIILYNRSKYKLTFNVKGKLKCDYFLVVVKTKYKSYFPSKGGIIIFNYFMYFFFYWK